MNLEPFEQLNVDPKDLDCGICRERYAPITREPMIMVPCEHPICSSCFPNIQAICPFCKVDILKKPIKNRLLSSLLERDSQVKKCSLHNQPLKLYCNEEKKLFCSECFEQKHQDNSQPIKIIEAKIKEIKNAEKQIHDKKEENKKDINEKLKTSSLNLKRKLDDLYDFKLAQDLSGKKKLKRMIYTWNLTEKDFCEHQMLAQELPKFEENAKLLQENWRNDPQGITAAQILETPLEPQQAIQFYNDKANQISKNIIEKEKSLEKIFMEPKSDLYESSKCLFDRISENFLSLNPNVKLNSKESSRDYLLSTFYEHGLIVKYQDAEDSFEIQGSTSQAVLKRFYPDLFECSIEKLSFSCLCASDLKFQVLCNILQNTQGLSYLKFSLKETSSKKVDMISSLVSKSKTLQKIYFNMPLCDEVKEASGGYIKSLLNSKKISSFHAGLTSETLLVDFEQDFSRPSRKAFEQFSAKFTGYNQISEHLIPLLSSSFSNTTTLRKISLHFGDQYFYSGFLKNLHPVLNPSENLQELDLGFAEVDELQNHGHGQQISQIIRESKKLKKVSLFLAGKDLPKDVFDDFFYLEEPKVFAEHKLEEFTLTIMRCRDVDLEDLINYFLSFPKLQKIVLRLNRVYLDFQRIENFLTGILKLESLVSFEFACRDYGQLTEAEKAQIDVCKYRLEKTQKIQHRIVFEDLQTYHLPDYVDFISEDEEEQEENEYENEDEEEGEEEEEYNENEEEEAQDQDVPLEEMSRIERRRRARREALANQR